MNVRIWTLLGLGFGFLALLLVGFFVYSSGGGSEEELAEARKLMRVVTPLPAPKMMDLPQVCKLMGNLMALLIVVGKMLTF